MPAVRKVTPGERKEGDPTPGIVREEAIATEFAWAGLARTAPAVASGWHHHGENDTIVYVEAGRFRVEFGVEGKEAVEAHPGDFVFIPKGVVHRELNPAPDESRLIVVRMGSGPPTINAAGPSDT